MQPKKGEVYRHSKGGRYVILCLAHNSNDPVQQMVVYQSLTDSFSYPVGTIWVRTLTEFCTPGRFVKE